MKKIKIAYYSGTGGTARAAECFQRSWAEMGFETELERITTGDAKPFTEHDLLILLFPVHAFNAPHPVYKWINDVTGVQGVPAVVVSVSGGGEISPNTACRVSPIRRLRRKGYRVVYETMIVMPSNCISAVGEELSVTLLSVLPGRVDQIVKELSRGVSRRSIPLPQDRLFSFLGEGEKPLARLWGNRIKVSGNCNGCGLCAKNCPSGNISMKHGEPRFSWKCHLCLRCIYDCPQAALSSGFGKNGFILKDGYDLAVWEKQITNGALLDVSKLPTRGAWKGVTKYLEEYISERDKV